MPPLEEYRQEYSNPETHVWRKLDPAIQAALPDPTEGELMIGEVYLPMTDEIGLSLQFRGFVKTYRLRNLSFTQMSYPELEDAIVDLIREFGIHYAEHLKQQDRNYSECKGCASYAGYGSGENYFHCAIYPYGDKPEDCSDRAIRQTEPQGFSSLPETLSPRVLEQHSEHVEASARALANGIFLFGLI